ncbi:cysteine desulfurase family protein [Gordonia sp. DT30]|uniref:cysteine desulfurase family protein n=1 Tax=unclassified Gordonia (in: high G+C Gram-positive bacteria) TaxID=2657482 RepID=UPI003CF97E72
MSTLRRAPVYLDHAASTAVLPEAIEAMNAVHAQPGNASSLHGAGRWSRRRLEEARETVAAAVGARPSEVIFTSGGTEADNLALKGIYWARRQADDRRRRVVISAIEHHAIIDSAQWLATQGAHLVILPVDEFGFVAPAALRDELAAHADETAVVSIMWANNEVGTIEPIAELAAIATEYGVPMHSDAVQAVGHVPVDFGGSGLAALSLAAHKFGGPQGIGALLLGRDVACVPLLHGGGHERDVRSGTQPVAAIVGMATALRIATQKLAESMPAVAALRDELFATVLDLPGTSSNGPRDERRLPGNVHVSFDGCEGDSLLMLLDAKGVECSTGSACTAGVAQASHVLLAMGLDMAGARGSLRFSLASSSTRSDIETVGKVIGEVVERARVAGLVASPGGRSA